MEREKRIQNLRTTLSLQEVKELSEAKILSWMYGKKISCNSSGISKLFWVFSRSEVQAGVLLSLFFKTEGVFSADKVSK